MATRSFPPPLPSARVMYRALVERDPEFDGLFLVGVTTTAIYCRPVCPARKPRPENVRWFASADEAERAGFRACKRCRPHAAPGGHPEWVERLVADVERDPARRIGDDDLRARGLCPVRARRYFRARFGSTFQAWQRARRLGLAREKLAGGAAPLDAGYSAGFESDSGFRDAFQKLFGDTPSAARGRSAIAAREIATPLGPMIAAAGARGVCFLEFADRRALAAQAAALRRWFDAPVAIGTNDHLDALACELEEYFAGRRLRFEVPLALAGTPFQRAVWRDLAEIPYGETRSYRSIALRIENPGAVRAVGRANGQNRLAILIPCHRVVREDGTLCGYAGGVWRKRRLLDLEQAVVAGTAPQPLAYSGQNTGTSVRVIASAISVSGAPARTKSKKR